MLREDELTLVVRGLVVVIDLERPLRDAEVGDGMDGIEPRIEDAALPLVGSVCRLGLAGAGAIPGLVALGFRAKPRLSAVNMRSSCLSFRATFSLSSRLCSSSSARSWSESSSSS